MINKSKIICFDLRPLQIGHENRGIGMVVKSVLENLPDDDTKYLFYAFKKNNPIKSLGIKVGTKNYKIVYSPTLKHEVKKLPDMIDGIKMMHHTFKPLKKYRPDAFVQFDAYLGVPKWRHTKKYVVGYDLIPMIMRNEYLPSPISALRINRRINLLSIIPGILTFPFHLRKAGIVLRKIKMRVRKYLRSSYHLTRYKHSSRVYKKVDGILCISKATKKSFKDLLHIKEEKLFDLPLAAVISDAKTSSKVAEKIEKPYIFYIGGTDDRKRVQDIIHAYNIARGRGANIRLVLAGNEFKKLNLIPNLILRHAIFSSPYREDIILAGFVNDAEKLDLYKNALAFVFASAYEGFGLPVLEAAEMNCPVIAYDNSSISELASNDSAILVETGDFVGIAKAIERLLSEKTLGEELAAKAKIKSAKYGWVATTKNLLSIVSRR